MRILYIEDNGIDQVVFQRAAMRLGYTVEVCGGASSACDSLSSGKYDVAVCDYNLSDTVGEEMAVTIRLFVKRVCYLTGEPTFISSQFSVFDKKNITQHDHPLWQWIARNAR